MLRNVPEMIALVLVVLWLFGAYITPIGGGLVHLLLLAVVAIIVVRLIQSGRVPY